MRHRREDGLSRFVHDNALSLVFAAGFLLTLAGQALAGHAEFDNEQRATGLPEVTLARYLTSASFATDVVENWQSEYLQFLLYILGTIWFAQRGSPDSKEPGKQGPGSDEEQMVGPHSKPDSPRWSWFGGWRTALYGRSLGLVIAVVSLASWLAQSIAGRISLQRGAAARPGGSIHVAGVRHQR